MKKSSPTAQQQGESRSGGNGSSGGRSVGSAMLGRLGLMFLAVLSCSLVLILSLVLREHSAAEVAGAAPLKVRTAAATQSPRVKRLAQLLRGLHNVPETDNDRYCVAWGSLGGCETNASLLASCALSCRFFLYCGLCKEGELEASKCENCATPHAKPSECGESGDLAAAEPRHVDSRMELPQNSRVLLEVGGNLGNDLAAFMRNLPPTTRIYSSEAVPDFYDVLEKTYASQRVKVLKFGLADTEANTSFKIDGVDGQASGGLKTREGDWKEEASGKRVQVVLRDVHEVLAEIQEETGIPPDAMSINCEGCEYPVLQRMADKGWLPRIAYLQLSWHTVNAVRDRTAQRCELERSLRRSHRLLWYDGFYGWQGWVRRERDVEAGSVDSKV